MSFNESTYEQTPAMRDAIAIVVKGTRGGEYRRKEIADIVLSIANEATFDAVAMANLTFLRMARPRRELIG